MSHSSTRHPDDFNFATPAECGLDRLVLPSSINLHESATGIEQIKQPAMTIMCVDVAKALKTGFIDLQLPGVCGVAVELMTFEQWSLSISQWFSTSLLQTFWLLAWPITPPVSICKSPAIASLHFLTRNQTGILRMAHRRSVRSLRREAGVVTELPRDAL